jgi:subtilisin family serine protease
MKIHTLLAFVLASVASVHPAQAAGRVIARVNGGAGTINSICVSLSCTVTQSIGDPLGQLYVITSTTADTQTLVSQFSALAAIIDCEPDQVAHAAASTYTPPAALTDTRTVDYFGVAVPHGYLSQPAVGLLRISDAQTTFGIQGSGTVAVIDTGIDVHHPTLAGSLLPGYDFTRNQNGADETLDVNLSSPPSLGSPAAVGHAAIANLDQSTAAVVDGNGPYGDFGHGTMVAGVIHLAAPGAKILPFKVFGSDGSGYTSDILRAIYKSVQGNANIINMSFNLSSYSTEIRNAINYANARNLICVAATGNSGENTVVYPAGLTNLVMGIASTDNSDRLSSFSNYGSQMVWVGAPGEGIVTTYPYGTYAAAWGTSFSAPFAAGAAALLLQVSSQCNQSSAAAAIAHAQSADPTLGNGVLDFYQAVQAWRGMLGLQ